MQTEYFCPGDAWPRVVAIVRNSFIVKGEHVEQPGHVDFLDLTQNPDDKCGVMIGASTPSIKEPEPEPKSLIPWLKLVKIPEPPVPPTPENHISIQMHWNEILSSPLAEKIAGILTAHGAICYDGYDPLLKKNVGFKPLRWYQTTHDKWE